MSTLYTFGCSFTQDFEKLSPDDPQIKYVNEFIGGIIPPTWSKILSNLLEYDRVNTSSGGIGNDVIFENVCKMSPNFKKGDIVIIQWTQNHRFRWPHNYYDNHDGFWVNQIPNYYREIPTLSKRTFEEILLIRDHPLYRKQLYNHQILIEQLAMSVGFDIYYWAMGEKIISELPKDRKFLLRDKFDRFSHNWFTYFSKMNAHTITQETNGVILDGHYSKTGHEVIGKLFYEHITKNVQ
jgi:hypothetical protein